MSGWIWWSVATPQTLAAEVTAAGNTASVTIDASATTTPIPRGFVGIGSSASPSKISGWYGSGAASDVLAKYMMHLTRLEGAPVIRIGGRTQDEVYYQAAPNDPPPPFNYFRKPALEVLGPQHYAAMARFSWKSGCPFTLGVNYGANSPELAANQIAGAISAKFPPAGVLGYDVGNEPNSFHRDPKFYRATPWSLTEYTADFRTFVSALRLQHPNVPLSATAVSSQGWLPPAATGFGNFLGAVGNQLSFFTVHHYAFNVDSGVSDPALTLLSPGCTTAVGPKFSQTISQCAAAGLRVRMNETNSVSGGGLPGVSDTLAGGLWVADILAVYAKAGFEGINIFGGGGAYTPFAVQAGAGTAVAFPPFYGMYFFADFMQNFAGLIPTSAVTATGNTTCYACRDSGASLRVLMVNKDPDKSLTQTIVINNALTFERTGRLKLLKTDQANPLAAKTGITVGGQSFDGNANLIGSAVSTPITGTGTTTLTFSVDLPPASAGIFELDPQTLTAPQVTVESTGNPVLENSPVALTATARGSAPFTYQWHKNGVAIPGAINPRLYLPPPQITANANYTVTVTSRAGTKSASQSVVVAQVPDITSPLTATAIVGRPFQYSVTATNQPTAMNATSLPAGLTFDSASNTILGTPAVIGTSNVVLSARNLAGTDTATLVITVKPDDVVVRRLAMTGEEPASAGGSVPIKSTWTDFGPPSSLNDGSVALAMAYQAAGVKTKGLFLIDNSGKARVLATVGQPVEAYSGAVYSAFRNPVAASVSAGDAECAFLALLKGQGVRIRQNAVLCRISVDAVGHQRSMLARVGEAIEGVEYRIARFISLTMGSDGTLWALVRLQSGFGKITSASDSALLRWETGKVVPEIVLQEGSSFKLGDGAEHRLVSFETLLAVPGTQGHSRWIASGEAIARARFSDGIRAILKIGGSHAPVEVCRSGAAIAPGGLGNAMMDTVEMKWSALGVPTIDALGGIAFLGKMAASSGRRADGERTGIYYRERDAWTEIARIGSETGSEAGVRFFGLGCPVSNSDGAIAFTARERGRNGTRTAIWLSQLTGDGTERTLRRIAATTEAAPGTGGAVFSRLASLALPDGTGVIFVGRLKRGNISGQSSVVTAGNDSGLWAEDQLGTLHLLLRTGSPLPGYPEATSPVKSFKVLHAVAYSPSQPRSYNNQAEVICNVTYNDGKSALVKFVLPRL